MTIRTQQLGQSIFVRTLESSYGASRPVASKIAVIGQAALALPFWAWCVPCLAIIVLLLATGPLLPWFVGKYAWTGKDLQEVVGPSLLGAAVAIAAFQCALRTSACRIWLLSIPLILLCRELHFRGTGLGVYLGLIAVIWFGIRNSSRLAPVWNNRQVCGCLFSAACLYAIAVSVDSGVWKFLPHAHWWAVNVEETFESTGHFVILCSSLCAVLLADRVKQ